jgi:hypothetical protein
MIGVIVKLGKIDIITREIIKFPEIGYSLMTSDSYYLLDTGSAFGLHSAHSSHHLRRRIS